MVTPEVEGDGFEVEEVASAEFGEGNVLLSGVTRLAFTAS